MARTQYPHAAGGLRLGSNAEEHIFITAESSAGGAGLERWLTS